METKSEELRQDFQLDRRAFSVASVTEPDDAVAYWRSRPVEERIGAIELLRRTFYGAAATSERLQRVFEVVRVEWR